MLLATVEIYIIVLDGNIRAFCINTTTKVAIKPSNEVDAFIEHILAKIGEEPTPSMPIV